MAKRSSTPLLTLLLLLITCTGGLAQNSIYDRLPLAEDGRELSSPAQFLGYRLGERFTEYARSVAYFDYLAAASPRLTIERYGKTYEGRELLLVVASAEENIAGLESIRQAHLSTVGGQANPDLPVINSYSYNIHGNEASSTEAAMQFAWELATSDEPALTDALEETINLLFVCINPDGRDRYVYWANGMKHATGGESPADLEHHAPWPNGRTNHYWFDLNRDWIWGVHPESRGHTAKYQEWMPNVHTDYHEQGYDANYFTVPGTTPRNLLLPEAYEIWADTFGRANIAEFDKKGLSYFTRDRFDFYYPSYGSSYPSVMGAIGMLTEQGGIGANLAVKTEDGYVLTLRQRVYDHYTTSRAQFLAAARNRQALRKYSAAAWNPANSPVATKTYVIDNDGNPYLQDLLSVLLLNGVEVERTTAAFSGSGASYRENGRVAKREHPVGSLLIHADQPRHLLVHSLLARDMQIEDSVMYDMSTWSAPLAYNLNAYSYEARPRVQSELVQAQDSTYRRRLATPRDAYAVVIPWRQRHAPRALARLWEEGYRVRAAHEPFTDANGRTYEAGTLIVLRGRNDGRLPNSIRYPEVEMIAMSTGRMAAGMDLASTRNEPVEQPKVAMLVEPPFNTYTSGQIYFLFDQEVQLPVDRIRLSQFADTDVPRFGSRYGYSYLDDYDVLILPEANGLDKVFGEKGRQKLLDWTKAGGTIIAYGSSATFLNAKHGFEGIEVLGEEKDSSAAAKTLRYAERTDYYGKQNIPGSALYASVDNTHPLAYGLPESVFTLKFGRQSLVPSTGLQSVGRYGEDAGALLVSGYAPRAALDSLAGNTWAGVLPLGRGRVVYLLDNPHYRMFWRGAGRLVVNGVMLLGGRD